MMETRQQLKIDIVDKNLEIERLKDTINDYRIGSRKLSRDVDYAKTGAYPKKAIEESKVGFLREIAELKAENIRVRMDNDHTCSLYDAKIVDLKEVIDREKGINYDRGYAKGLQEGIGKDNDVIIRLIKALADAKVPVPTQTIVNGEKIIKA